MPTLVTNEHRQSVDDRREEASDLRIPIPAILSALAIVVSVAAIGLILTKSEFGRTIEEYDLSTPEAALRSLCEIQANRDVVAQMQLALLAECPFSNQKLQTFAVHKSVQWKGKTVLCTSFDINGAKQHECPAFVKDAETGYWIPKGETVTSVAEIFEGVTSTITGVRTEADHVWEALRKWRHNGVLD